MKASFFFLFFAYQIALGQTLEKITTTPLVADTFIGVDTYKNMYSINTNVFRKIGPDGDFVFNDLQLGQLTSVDIINPLKIMLFYEDVNTAVFLDNKLNEIERINFSFLPESITISHAKNAGNNRLWVFNVDTQQLELLNYRSNVKLTVSQPFTGNLIWMNSNFNYCYTLTDLKLRAFNIYGSLLYELPSNEFQQLIQQEKTLLAVKDDKLYYSNTANLNFIFVETPELTIKGLHLTQDFLYIYDGKLVHTFRLTNPKK